MKWTYAIKNKFTASIVLLVLCLLVLFSNYLDRIHTRSVKNFIATLYEDRLIAEGYILKMTGNIYQIREVFGSGLDNAAKINISHKLIDDFNSTYNMYIKTKLTTIENATAIELLNNFKQIELNKDYTVFTEKALASLSKLSSIQLEESKLILKKSESEYANIKASSQFAYAVIIIILVVLQALVFSSKTLFPLNKPKDHTFN